MFSIVVTMFSLTVTTVKYLNKCLFLASMPDTMIDYGTAERPNLEAISKEVEHIFRFGFSTLGFRGDFTLQSTPDKTTTARAIVDVFYNGVKVGDLYVILFAPGDGTGKAGDYSLDQFTNLPSEYRFETKPERVLPRNKLKEGVLLEACFPFATVEGSSLFRYLVSLEQVTVDDAISPTSLMKGLRVGKDEKNYTYILRKNVLDYEPSTYQVPTYLTCGYCRNGQRFGDPHATFYNPKLAEGHPNRMQVAGFLSVESADNPLCKVLDTIAIVPE